MYSERCLQHGEKQPFSVFNGLRQICSLPLMNGLLLELYIQFKVSVPILSVKPLCQKLEQDSPQQK